MAFCINFVLVARQNPVTCYFTRILPGLSFSLIYGSLVTKTNRIARILDGKNKIITQKQRCMSDNYVYNYRRGERDNYYNVSYRTRRLQARLSRTPAGETDL